MLFIILISSIFSAYAGMMAPGYYPAQYAPAPMYAPQGYSPQAYAPTPQTASSAEMPDLPKVMDQILKNFFEGMPDAIDGMDRREAASSLASLLDQVSSKVRQRYKNEDLEEQIQRVRNAIGRLIQNAPYNVLTRFESVLPEDAKAKLMNGERVSMSDLRLLSQKDARERETLQFDAWRLFMLAWQIIQQSTSSVSGRGDVLQVAQEAINNQILRLLPPDHDFHETMRVFFTTTTQHMNKESPIGALVSGMRSFMRKEAYEDLISNDFFVKALKDFSKQKQGSMIPDVTVPRIKHKPWKEMVYSVNAYQNYKDEHITKLMPLINAAIKVSDNIQEGFQKANAEITNYIQNLPLHAFKNKLATDMQAIMQQAQRAAVKEPVGATVLIYKSLSDDLKKTWMDGIAFDPQAYQQQGQGRRGGNSRETEPRFTKRGVFLAILRGIVDIELREKSREQSQQEIFQFLNGWQEAIPTKSPVHTDIVRVKNAIETGLKKKTPVGAFMRSVKKHLSKKRWDTLIQKNPALIAMSEDPMAPIKIIGNVRMNGNIQDPFDVKKEDPNKPKNAVQRSTKDAQDQVLGAASKLLGRFGL